MNTKTTFVLIIGIILLAEAAMLGARLMSGPEDAWLCVNGQWVKHGKPSSDKPEAVCEPDLGSVKEDKIDDAEEDIVLSAKGMNIEVTKPTSGESISSPLEIVGKATGHWFFEGDFPVKLLDKNGKEIAAAPAKALGEWMTEDSVPFRAILEFSAPLGSEATLVFTQDNPADNSAVTEFKVPVKIEKQSGKRIKLFFSNLYFDPETEKCEGVYEVERVIPETKAVARAAIEELLSGITEEERDAGFFTSINQGVKLNNITITNGVAKVDFSPRMEEGMGGSCRTAAIRSQIEKTLKQFPTVKSVVISVDGKTEGILQP